MSAINYLVAIAGLFFTVSAVADPMYGHTGVPSMFGKILICASLETSSLAAKALLNLPISSIQTWFSLS